MLENIEKSLYQIEHLIKTNKDIQKLLFYNNFDPLGSPDITPSTIDEYIYLNPLLEVTNDPPYNKANFISIHIASIENIEEEAMQFGALRINIACTNSLWKISGSKIRPITISNIIVNLLNNSKFSTSHKILFESAESFVLDKQITGIALIFSIDEGGGLENEF